MTTLALENDIRPAPYNELTLITNRQPPVNKLPILLNNLIKHILRDQKNQCNKIVKFWSFIFFFLIVLIVKMTGEIPEKSIFDSGIALIRYKLIARNSRQQLLGNTAAPIGRTITMEEVSWHDQVQDCWVIIYDRVYDVTNFLDQHPGGADLLIEQAGRDASVAFRGSGHSEDSLEMLKKYYVGDLPMEERIFRKPNGYKLSDIPV